MLVFHHQRLPMLIEKETDLGGRCAVLEQQRVADERFEIKVLDRFQRTPYLLPSATEFGPIQQIHYSSFPRGDLYLDP